MKRTYLKDDRHLLKPLLGLETYLKFPKSSEHNKSDSDENYSEKIQNVCMRTREDVSDTEESVSECSSDIEVSSPTTGRFENHQTEACQKKLLILTVAVSMVITCVAVRIALPLYAKSSNLAGGDDFTVLLYASMWHPVVMVTVTVMFKAFWDRSITIVPAVPWKILLLIGALSMLNGTCFAFSADRTPPHIQGILLAARIPFTVLARFALLRKGLSVRRFVCTIAVIAGLIVSVEPQIRDTGTGSGSHVTAGSSFERVLWPIVFCLAYLPASVECVIFERELKRENQALSIFMWSQVFRLVTVLPLFWLDFVPVFGMAKSFQDFGHRLYRGITCNFSFEPDCHGLLPKSWFFIATYNVSATLQFVLIQKAEGAVFTAVVQSLVMPLTTLFWTFISYSFEEDEFQWTPAFTNKTVFTVVGLVIIFPAVLLYSVFSERESKQTNEYHGTEREQ